MKQRRAAAPYAKALFAFAKERNQTELVGRELGDLAATLERDLDLRDQRTAVAAPIGEISPRRASQIDDRTGEPVGVLTGHLLHCVCDRDELVGPERRGEENNARVLDVRGNEFPRQLREVGDVPRDDCTASAGGVTQLGLIVELGCYRPRER